MRKAFKILFAATFLFALLVIPGDVALAALVKTTSIVELDAWQEVPQATLAVGDPGDISDSYETILYLEIAYTDSLAQDGVGVSIEVSYGDDDWTLLTKPFTTPGGSGEVKNLEVGVTAGDTTVDLDEASNFNTHGQKFIVVDGGNTETVRVKSEVDGVVTLCHDFMFNHDAATPAYAEVHEYIFLIPASFAYVRVLINNTDADADIYFTTRLSKVTEL